MRAIKTITISVLAVGLLAGSAVGVAAQDEDDPAAPVEFSGNLNVGGEITGPVIENLPGRIASEGRTFATSASMSDPRLSGNAIYATNSDRHLVTPSFIIEHVAFRIENSEGAWQEQPRVNVILPGRVSGLGLREATAYHVFAGEGAYEGFTAVAESAPTELGWRLEGFIIDGEVPPPPNTLPAE